MRCFEEVWYLSFPLSHYHCSFRVTAPSHTLDTPKPYIVHSLLEAWSVHDPYSGWPHVKQSWDASTWNNHCYQDICHGHVCQKGWALLSAVLQQLKSFRDNFNWIYQPTWPYLQQFKPIFDIFGTGCVVCPTHHKRDSSGDIPVQAVLSILHTTNVLSILHTTTPTHEYPLFSQL